MIIQRRTRKGMFGNPPYIRKRISSVGESKSFLNLTTWSMIQKPKKKTNEQKNNDRN